MAAERLSDAAIERLNRQAATVVSTMCAHEEDDPEFRPLGSDLQFQKVVRP